MKRRGGPIAEEVSERQRSRRQAQSRMSAQDLQQHRHEEVQRVSRYQQPRKSVETDAESVDDAFSSSDSETLAAQRSFFDHRFEYAEKRRPGLSTWFPPQELEMAMDNQCLGRFSQGPTVDWPKISKPWAFCCGKVDCDILVSLWGFIQIYMTYYQEQNAGVLAI